MHFSENIFFIIIFYGAEKKFGEYSSKIISVLAALVKLDDGIPLGVTTHMLFSN